ncbi:MAG TPA: N-acetylmuramoyl-L-alanine amidase [Flavisolibacter sp.]|nr:N-acetylmuramoyl-L-alanine amidase [Flavisolibacter sp.]
MFYLPFMKWMALFFLFFVFQNLNAQNFFSGRTTGPLPYLAYGQGEDRLGGAKMTYLDSNILVKVVDSFKTDYKIQLSANHFAFLPKQNFKTDSAIRLQPFYLTSSWRVWGDERYDYVTIGLPEKLPYRSIQMIDPSRIVIDIFGVTSNTNWITQLKTVREISNVWYEQPEDDLFRVFIELKHQQHWGYFISYNKNMLQVRIKRQPSSLKPKHLLVAIDPGHGGTNSGATGLTTKIAEKDYTLKIAGRLKQYLQKKKFRTYMTREADSSLDMIQRTQMLREQDPDMLISIHLNSSSNTEVKGVSTYYRYIGFRPLSQHILDRMLQLGLNNFGNVGSFNFSLSGPTEYPNCLVEVAFLSNEEDEKKILSEDFHKAVAKKIYKGIRDWLKRLD